MTKKELIELLVDVPDDHIVILASDGEGNSFSPLADYGVGVYMPDTTYAGDFLTVFEIEDLDADEKALLEDCVVLWPEN